MDHNYNLLRPHCFDFSAITEATADEIKAASSTMDVGLLDKTMLCPQCAEQMDLHKKRRANEKQEQHSIFVSS
ncbi:hypothetical protein JG688_00007505 [Phytophthora aleatoria]|uniref:Uncharacterized protein n=1 Tax=Phytophthora aleatoria TaxID=2496075 RepID=A0A8J5J5W4_9STRA|nr:hypothetical protein JG688_00007505 [Phytophthora aleatoria]